MTAAPSFEHVSVIRCPNCSESSDDGSISVLESAEHVYRAYVDELDGSVRLSWITTTDGAEDYRFLCQECGHEWEVPSCFRVR